MTVTPEFIDGCKEILNNPSKYNFDCLPFKECFVEDEAITPKHILANQYLSYLNNSNVNKFIVYILMDDAFGFCHGKAPNGDAGYKLKIAPQILSNLIKDVLTAPVF